LPRCQGTRFSEAGCLMTSVADKLSSFLSISFGFKGARNIAAWAVAGGVAYVWLIRPEQLRKQQEKVCVTDAVTVPPR
jgi:hypothetical protein